MKNVLEIQRTDLLKLFLLFLLTPLTTLLMGQAYVDGGGAGGKVFVDITEGAGGGPHYFETDTLPKMCLQVGDCQVVTVGGGFVAVSGILTDKQGVAIPGHTITLLSSSGGVQTWEICTSASGFTGVAHLWFYNFSVDAEGEAIPGDDPDPEIPEYLGLVVCISTGCPACIYNATSTRR